MLAATGAVVVAAAVVVVVAAAAAVVAVAAAAAVVAVATVSVLVSLPLFQCYCQHAAAAFGGQLKENYKHFTFADIQ